MVHLVEHFPGAHQALDVIPNITYMMCTLVIAVTREVEVGGSEVQGHAELHREHKSNLNHLRPSLRQTKGSQENTMPFEILAMRY